MKIKEWIKKLVKMMLPVDSKRRKLAKKIYMKIFRKCKYSDEILYDKWIRNNEPTSKELEKQKNKEFVYNPKISIIVPMYNTPEEFFKELVECLKSQTYSNWELCLADGSPDKLTFIEKYINGDERIKYSIIGENKGISGNTNEALKLATGDFIGLLDHDDLLPKFSLYEVVKSINENEGVEFLYSDEDKINSITKKRYEPFFKPDFSKYTLRSVNYICHFSIFKKSLMDKLGGFKSEYDGSQDFDIVIRASENTNKIVHIPKILYHWRVHPNSTAGNADSKPYAYEVAKNVIKDHLLRSNVNVNIEDGLSYGSYEVQYQVNQKEKVLLILDFKELKENEIKEKIALLKNNTDYDMYEYLIITKNVNIENENTIESRERIFELYNQIIKDSDSKYFMILDSKLEAINKKSWLQDLLGIAQDSEVGIVGTKLINPKNLVEHTGIVVGMNGIGDFLYNGVNKDCRTYMQRLKIIHNVSGVLFKYSLINKEYFLNCNSFDLNYNGLASSIDLCLKLLENNKLIVMNPIIEITVQKLIDCESDDNQSTTLINKWKKVYSKGDIYFSNNLSKRDTGVIINVE